MDLDWRLRGRIAYQRARRWEFWPTWLFYIPVILWILLLGLRHRHFTLFTAANPGMDDGGVVGERKHPLLQSLRKAQPQATPPLLLLSADMALSRRQLLAKEFIDSDYPVVLKPDVGQRGRGVLIARNQEQIKHYLSQASFDFILQKFVPGKEFGIFVYRDPNDGQPRIFSVTAKELMHVHGDGKRSLRQLILDHPRAWLMAEMLFRTHADKLERIIAQDQNYYLVNIGSHCRGAVFLNGKRLITTALEKRVATIVDALPGFHFGRLDLIAPSRQALREGRDLQVLEVNGVTAEAAHVYHPGTPLREGYASFFRQWQLAFAVGRNNRRQGAKTVSPIRLLRLFLQDLQRNAGAESVSRNAAEI